MSVTGFLPKKVKTWPTGLIAIAVKVEGEWIPHSMSWRRACIGNKTRLVITNHTWNDLLGQPVRLVRDKEMVNIVFDESMIEFYSPQRQIDVMEINIPESVYSVLGVKALKNGNSNGGHVVVYGFVDGELHQSVGTYNRAEDVGMILEHDATTCPGWSGSPMISSGMAQGTHICAMPESETNIGVSVDFNNIAESLFGVEPEGWYRGKYGMQYVDDQTWADMRAQRKLDQEVDDAEERRHQKLVEDNDMTGDVSKVLGRRAKRKLKTANMEERWGSVNIHGKNGEQTRLDQTGKFWHRQREESQPNAAVMAARRAREEVSRNVKEARERDQRFSAREDAWADDDECSKTKYTKKDLMKMISSSATSSIQGRAESKKSEGPIVVMEKIVAPVVAAVETRKETGFPPPETSCPAPEKNGGSESFLEQAESSGALKEILRQQKVVTLLVERSVKSSESAAQRLISAVQELRKGKPPGPQPSPPNTQSLPGSSGPQKAQEPRDGVSDSRPASSSQTANRSTRNSRKSKSKKSGGLTPPIPGHTPQ